MRSGSTPWSEAGVRCGRRGDGTRGTARGVAPDSSRPGPCQQLSMCAGRLPAAYLRLPSPAGAAAVLAARAAAPAAAFATSSFMRLLEDEASRGQYASYINVLRSTEASDIQRDADGQLSVTLRNTRLNSSMAFRPKLVLGCDGINSVVRSTLQVSTGNHTLSCHPPALSLFAPLLAAACCQMAAI